MGSYSCAGPYSRERHRAGVLYGYEKDAIEETEGHELDRDCLRFCNLSCCLASASQTSVRRKRHRLLRPVPLITRRARCGFIGIRIDMMHTYTCEIYFEHRRYTLTKSRTTHERSRKNGPGAPGTGSLDFPGKQPASGGACRDRKAASANTEKKSFGASCCWLTHPSGFST